MPLMTVFNIKDISAYNPLVIWMSLKMEQREAPETAFARGAGQDIVETSNPKKITYPKTPTSAGGFRKRMLMLYLPDPHNHHPQSLK